MSWGLYNPTPELGQDISSAKLYKRPAIFLCISGFSYAGMAQHPEKYHSRMLTIYSDNVRPFRSHSKSGRVQYNFILFLRKRPPSFDYSPKFLSQLWYQVTMESVVVKLLWSGLIALGDSNKLLLQLSTTFISANLWGLRRVLYLVEHVLLAQTFRRPHYANLHWRFVWKVSRHWVSQLYPKTPITTFSPLNDHP